MQDLGETKSVDREFGETNPGDRLENGSMGKRKFRNTKVRIHELELINRTAENVSVSISSMQRYRAGLWRRQSVKPLTLKLETGDIKN